MRKLRLLQGWIRLNIWGVCPYCNHDAPLLYDCPVCSYYMRLPRYREDQTEEDRKETWRVFKLNI